MVKKKSNFSFKGQVASDAKRQQKAASSYGYLLLPKDLSIFSPEPGGRVTFDIIPYTVTNPKHPDRNVENNTALEGNPWYKYPIKIHRNVGSTNEIVICLTTVGKKCPVCEFRAKRIRENADKEETDALKISLRNLYLVIPKGHKKFEEKLHLFDISQYNFQVLLNEELAENPENEIFPSLDEGKSLKVRFESKTIAGGQPFAQANRIDFEERDEQYDWSMLEDSPNLDKMLNILSYDELRAKLEGIEDEEIGGSLKKVKADDDEEEEDDEQEEEEDDEEEEEPVRKKKVLSKKKPVKEEEEPEEEEEEEEEPTPVRRKKPVKKLVAAGDDDEEDDEEEAPPKKKKDRCPSGYRFGIDTDKYDECADCEIWDECSEAKHKSKKK